MASDYSGRGAIVGTARRRRMNGGKRARCVAGQPECRAKIMPVRGLEYIGIFDEHNRLALSRIARSKERVQIINSRQVRGQDRIVRTRGAPSGVLVLRQTQLVHRVWPEVVQRDDANDRGCERGGNPGIMHIAKVLLASYIQVMDLSLKGLAHLPGRA